jgi:hypothetical protein
MKNLPAYVILMAVILSACTPSKNVKREQTPGIATPSSSPSEIPAYSIGDGGLITGKPCAAPCFLGIRMGESTLDQALVLLNDYGIAPCVRDADPSITCAYRIRIGADTTSGLVDAIGYIIDDGMTVTVENVIDKYGDPDVIHMIPTELPESPSISVLVFYDELQMRIELTEVDGTEYLVSPSSQIDLVTCFLDHSVYLDLRQVKFSQPWKGYGLYQIEPGQ